jgi:hypothetical protein
MLRLVQGRLTNGSVRQSFGHWREQIAEAILNAAPSKEKREKMDLKNEAETLLQALCAASAAPGGNGAGVDAASSASDDVIDAEFTESL